MTYLLTKGWYSLYMGVPPFLPPSPPFKSGLRYDIPHNSLNLRWVKYFLGTHPIYCVRLPKIPYWAFIHKILFYNASQIMCNKLLLFFFLSFHFFPHLPKLFLFYRNIWRLLQKWPSSMGFQHFCFILYLHLFQWRTQVNLKIRKMTDVNCFVTVSTLFLV